MKSAIKDVKADNAYFDYLYARGYLISDIDYTVKDDWEKIFFQDLYITYDPKTKCYCQQAGDNFAILIGNVMDTMSWHMDANDVLKKIVNYMNDGDDEGLYDYLDWLGGRFIIIFGNGNKKVLLQDATGMRSAYYHEEKCLIASHYNLIGDIVDAPIHPFMEKFSQAKKYSLPGDISPRSGVYWLVPNHELDLNNMQVRRFWPRKKHEDFSIDESMDFIVDHVRNQMIVLNKYHGNKIALSMSGGQDCRVSLAASKAVGRDVLFFSVYNANHAAMSSDPIKAKEIINALGLDLKIVDTTNVKIDGEMNGIFQKNHYHSHNRKAIKAVMKELPEGLLHIRSNIIETVRETTYSTQAGDGESIHKSLYSDMISDKTCRKIFDEFSTRNEYANGLYNYHVGDILYWEYRVAEFVNCSCLLETDWCFDTYMLFNVRKVLEYGLSVPRYFKMNNRIPFEMEKRLWPETLFYIPNTNYTLLDYYSLDLNGKLEFTRNDSHSVFVDKENNQLDVKNKESLPIYCQSGRYAMTMGFNRSVVKNGDRVAYDKEIIISSSGTYDLQLNLYVENAWEKYSSECLICINGNQVYNVDLNAMLNIENQVNIIGNYKAKEKIKLSVQLISTAPKTFTKGVAGMIHIRNINLIKSPYKLADGKMVITSTLDWIRGDMRIDT